MTELQLEYADYCISKLYNIIGISAAVDVDWYDSKARKYDDRLSDEEQEKIRVILVSGNWIKRYKNTIMYSLDDSKLTVVNEHGSYSNYYKYLNKEKQLLKSKSDKKEQLETKIAELTEINLTLQNRQLKTKMLFSIIGFIFGFIAANWKEILTVLKIISPPETK